MPVMNFDLEDGKPPVTFTLKESDTVRFMAFMAECDRALNGRAAKPAPLLNGGRIREIAEEYCDVREECERGWEWCFNYSGLQNFAVALLSAAPPLPVAQEWISVKDRLPGMGEEVLISGWEYDMPDTKRWVSTSCLTDDGWEGEYYPPTHWMSLPAAPTPPAAPKEPT